MSIGLRRCDGFIVEPLRVHIAENVVTGVRQRDISFTNDVAPVLTKAGCNTGVYHAKACGGQNGFELSLLGFEPTVAAPEQSLLLQKANGQVSHGRGVRLTKDSAGYRQLRDWIAEGARDDADAAPKLVSIEVLPERGLLDQEASQQTGQCIGAADKRGEEVIERHCGPGDFLATICDHLGYDASKVFIKDFNRRPTPIVDQGKPIPELIRA